jgi:formamidopyrimidine-DNA glycosylase
LVTVECCPCHCRPIKICPDIEEIQQRALGKKVVSVKRRAKRIVIALQTGDAFVIEPRMTGLMLVADRPDPEHLRLRWDVLQNGITKSVWLWDRRGLGTVQLLSPAEQEEFLGPNRLGPDALEITAEDWQRRLKQTSRAIKVALLDQKLVAGIGNLYASEILHLSGISPRKKACRLSVREISLMAESVRSVLNDAIHHEGSTLSDGTYRNALNKSGGYQNSHRVYDRAGEPCPTCHAGEIRRIVQAQRSTFYCPRCQK